jgi:hypothetical protein
VTTGLRLPADGGGTAVFEWARGGGKLADLKSGFKEAYDRLQLSPQQQVALAIAFHCVPLRSIAFHCVPLRSIAFHCVPLRSIALHGGFKGAYDRLHSRHGPFRFDPRCSDLTSVAQI